MLKKLFLLFAVGFIMFSGSAGIAQSVSPDSAIPNDLEISLQRLGCFGSCPIYSLVINADGTVIFNGENTKVNGITKSKISRSELKSIIAEFENADFFKLSDINTETDCKSFIDDLPSEIISIKLHNQSKQIKHNFGCINSKKSAAERIAKIGRRIDEITKSERWLEPVTGLKFPPKKNS